MLLYRTSKPYFKNANNSFEFVHSNYQDRNYPFNFPTPVFFQRRLAGGRNLI